MYPNHSRAHDHLAKAGQDGTACHASGQRARLDGTLTYSGPGTDLSEEIACLACASTSSMGLELPAGGRLIFQRTM